MSECLNCLGSSPLALASKAICVIVGIENPFACLLTGESVDLQSLSTSLGVLRSIDLEYHVYI